MARLKHGEIGEVVCLACGYRGLDDGTERCPDPDCRGQLIPVNELGGGFDDELGIDPDDPKGVDALESLEGLREDEALEDDKFDDEY